jgi:hypothetical protein
MVFDTGAMIHTDDMDLCVGNGAEVAALAIDTYSLSLPAGLVLELNNCYFVLALNKNIISASCLEGWF